MLKVLMIADDLTGALDSGVKFAGTGAKTVVLPFDCMDVMQKEVNAQTDAEVLVIDAGSRHLSKEEAYARVWALAVEGEKHRSVLFYKKTDSAMRGNIGSELAAMLDASGENMLAFVPAMPDQDRITVRAVHLANGRPIAEGQLGKDQFEAIPCSYIPDLIRRQTNIKTVSVWKEQYQQLDLSGGEKRIFVYDAVCHEDMVLIADALEAAGKLKVLAGCSAFASVIAQRTYPHGKAEPITMATKKVAVICGSVHPVARQQLSYGEALGFCRINLTSEEALGKEAFVQEAADRAIQALREGEVVMIDANDMEPVDGKMAYALRHHISADEMRGKIARRLGNIAREIGKRDPGVLLVFVGGDTLDGFLSGIHHKRLFPINEITLGCVVSMVESDGECFSIVSKSGGLGEANWLDQLLKSLGGHEECSKEKQPSLLARQGE